MEGLTSFYSRKQQVDRILSQIERDAQKVETTRQELTENRKLQRELIDQFRNDLDYISKAKTAVNENSSNLNSALEELESRSQEVTESLDQIPPILEQGKTLKSEIEVYGKFIAEHRAGLNQLESDIATKKAELEIVQGNIKENNETIVRLIDDAEEMLKGATIAGLAGEFGKIRDELQTDLKKARNTVYIAAAFLAISVSPVIIHVFGPYFGLENHNQMSGATNLTEYLSQVLVRSVLLVPATWFARFAAKRYDRLFRLKEHYAYKYSLATAVEGFKKQAPEYSSEIAAETFFELTFNPAERLDKRRGRTRRKSIVSDALRSKIIPPKAPDNEAEA